MEGNDPHYWLYLLHPQMFPRPLCWPCTDGSNGAHEGSIENSWLGRYVSREPWFPTAACPNTDPLTAFEVSLLRKSAAWYSLPTYKGRFPMKIGSNVVIYFQKQMCEQTSLPCVWEARPSSCGVLGAGSPEAQACQDDFSLPFPMCPASR